MAGTATSILCVWSGLEFKVILQGQPARSSCKVALQGNPATSSCRVTLQGHPAKDSMAQRWTHTGNLRGHDHSSMLTQESGILQA